MATPLMFVSEQSNGRTFEFGEAPSEQLTDFLLNLNQRNQENLQSLPANCGDFKRKGLTKDIFLIAQQLGLDPLVGYQAVEMVQRFMVQQLTERLPGASLGTAEPLGIYQELMDQFPLIIFSCIQLASKHCSHSQMVDSNAAVRALRLLGHSVTKQGVLEMEMRVLKGLGFRLDVLNPLTYVETLLEVLRHNEPSVPVERLYPQCQHVLRFVVLEKAAVYDSLLVSTVLSSPSPLQRERFATVTEDCMLLGAGVASVAAYIVCFRKWQQVVSELSHITAISTKSITDFTKVTVKHLKNLHPTPTPACCSRRHASNKLI